MVRIGWIFVCGPLELRGAQYKGTWETGGAHVGSKGSGIMLDTGLEYD